MHIRTGIDIVRVERFKKILDEKNERLLRRLFLSAELARSAPAHLAGIYAAKEAVVKACALTAESWHGLEIRVDELGKPHVIFHADPLPNLVTHDLSIAHDGEYAVAQFVALAGE